MYARSRFEQPPANPRLPSQIRTQPLLYVLSSRAHLAPSANGCRLPPLTPFSTSLTQIRLGGRGSARLNPLTTSLTQAAPVSPFAATLTKTRTTSHTLFQSRQSQIRTQPLLHVLSSRAHLPLAASGCQPFSPTPLSTSRTPAPDVSPFAATLTETRPGLVRREQDRFREKLMCCCGAFLT
jgi:hypothetical protein